MKPEFETNLLAIMPDKYESIKEKRRIYASKVDAAINRTPTKYGTVKGNVAVIPVQGFIDSKETIWTMLGFETSSQTVANQVQAAVNDPSIGAVVLDIDSPGGTVLGLTSASEKIFNARGKKPIIAVANGLMASAAYFLGSAADEIVSDPDSMVGSIGTVSIHEDATKYLENMGVKVTIIRSDENKFTGSPYEALSDDVKAEFQDMVNRYADMFKAAVAKHRSISESVVRSDFGKGSVFDPTKAKSVGMIDRIGTLDAVLSKLMGKKTMSKSKAQAIVNMNKVS